MNIVYFLTYGYSLKTWKDSGQLDREIEHFKYWKKLNPNLNLTIITYGNEEDLRFINDSFITVVPVYKYEKFSNSKVINFMKSFFIVKNLKEITKGKFIDVVIQNQLLGSWIAYIFKKSINTSLIVRTGYDMYEFSIKENKSSLKKIFYRLLTKISLENSDLYTVTSNCDKNFLIKQFGENYDSKIKVRKNWVSLMNEKDIIPFDKRFNNRIVCVGRIEEQKNYETIIYGIKGTDFKIDIFGEGTLKSHILQLSREQNVDVKFKGIVDNSELKEMLKNYKYYLTASKFEGNPKSVLEAMAAGCLIIASDIKNHREFLNSENSILFEDKNSLNEIIKNLDNKHQYHNKLTKNALKTIRKNYELEKIATAELDDLLNLSSKN